MGFQSRTGAITGSRLPMHVKLPVLFTRIKERIRIMKIRNWSEEFNKLPKEIRLIGSALQAQTRIQHLRFEKERLKQRYFDSCREIAEHKKNIEKWLVSIDNDQ